MTDRENDPILLTPGPLTTALATRQALLRDWGSRDRRFLALTDEIRRELLAIAQGDADMTCVPLQGSGTFAVEATIATLLPPSGKLLVLDNGAYGRRMAQIAHRIGRSFSVLRTAEDQPVDCAALRRALARDTALTHVALVHCETSSGLLNPLPDVAAAAHAEGRRLIVDAMSSFGAFALDAGLPAVDAVVASANKCLEGVPGLAFAILRSESLAASRRNAPSLSLDLHDQWRELEKTGQWRFTPPTHAVAALAQALRAHAAEGGVTGRGARYRRNHRALVDGMRALGFETVLADAVQAPIIVAFRLPTDPGFGFEGLYEGMAKRGFLIYHGKLTATPSFRIGCIGDIDEGQMRAAVAAVGECLDDMGVGSAAPVENQT